MLDAPRWLLIGNSRWHWAERTAGGSLRGWDGAPDFMDGEVSSPPLAWAAVGPVPSSPRLPMDRRVSLADVPLAGCPPWLGVDRALAGWEAWRTLKLGVLVVDAGTVLSLTLVDGGGTFRG
ncbi:MAG: type III pantothenate kinase, partial [Cyanobium sp.]